MPEAAELGLIDDIKRGMRVFRRFNAEVDRLLSETPYTLTEKWILLDLLKRPQSSDIELRKALGMGPAQLSRTLKGLVEEALVARGSNPRHRKQRLLTLTPSGEAAAKTMDASLSSAIESAFARLANEGRGELVDEAVRDNPLPDDDARYPHVLRDPTNEAFAWVFSQLCHVRNRSTALAAQTASEIARFLQQSEKRRIAKIAYRGADVVGACLLPLTEDDLNARVAILYVDPTCRRQGIGTDLLAACIAEAKEMTLLSIAAEASKSERELDALYSKLGFTRVRGETMGYRFGRQETLRSYVLVLPLRR